MLKVPITHLKGWLKVVQNLDKTFGQLAAYFHTLAGAPFAIVEKLPFYTQKPNVFHGFPSMLPTAGFVYLNLYMPYFYPQSTSLMTITTNYKNKGGSR